jgi:hypothetical protein
MIKRLILIVSVLFITSLAYSGKDPKIVEKVDSDTVCIPKAELNEYLARIKKDKETIEELQKQRTELAASNISLRERVNQLELQAAGGRGVYIGANAGIPFGADAMVFYNLGKWGIYSLAGYHKAFHIDIGIGIRAK